MNNRKIIRKWIWAWEYEQEEKWLNEMAQEGWALARVSFCRYEFERCEPGEYILRFEMNDPSSSFISDVEATGAEYIGSVMNWCYFRRKASEGEFELIRNDAERIAYLDKLSRLVGILLFMNLAVGISCVRTSGFCWVNMAVAALMAYGLGRLHEKKALIAGMRTMFGDGKAR